MPRFWLWLLVCAGSAAATLQPTTTTLAVASGTPVYGSTFNVRAQVNANLGSITFTVDGQAAKPLAVDSNSGATIQLTLPAGSHSVGASFSAGDVYQPSTAAPLSITVAKASPVVGVSGGPAQIGQPVTITATVAIPGFGVVNGGTVSFAPAPQCGAVPVVYGVATCTIAFGAVGSFPVYATFSGDSNTSGVMATFSLTVAKAVPSIYITSTPLSPVWATPAGANALVLGASNSPPPTGTITFSAAGTALAIQSLGADGRASLSTLWAVGTYTISAVYSGDANYQTSPAVTTTITVSKAPTVLAVSSDPAQVGQPVTLRASVSLGTGTGTITGTVDFAIGGKAVSGCTGIPVSAGAASCQTSFPQTGALTLSGTFSGDANTRGTTAMAVININKAVPGIYLALSPSAPVFGQTVTLGCLVLGAPGLPAPTGSVTFTSGGKTLATQAVGGDGHAYWSTTWLAGASIVTATYSGDGNYQAPAAASLTLSVDRAPAVMAVSSDPAQVGQPVTLRASVSLPSGTGTITGTVDFSLAGKPVAGCIGIPITTGAASCQYSFPQLGTFTLAGSFSGDANTLPATATATVTIGKAAPGIYVAQSPTAPVFGQPVTLDSLLLGAPSLPAPTGIVTFTDGGRPLFSQAAGSDGHAAITSPLTVGLHSIVATYAGDTNYQLAASSPLGVTVMQAATSTSLSAVTGGPFAAVVTVTAPGAGTLTGSVLFRSGTTLIGSAPLVVAGATVTATLAASASTGSITASYSGDANFAASVSNPATVTAVQSIVTVTSDQNPSSAGQPVNFGIAVSVAPQAASGPPTGTVSLSADGIALGSASLSNSQATVRATLAIGSHTIAARYSGDSSYPAGSGTLVQVVGAAAASITLASSAPVAAFGQPVTLTATLGTQSGSVQFSDGATPIGTAAISAGSASLPVSLAAGIHSIAASWAGDATWAAASAQLVQTINPAATTLSLAIFGGALTAAVTVNAPGAGTPTGTVRFLDAATSSLLATVPLTSALAGAPLPAAADAVVAIYSGDGNFVGATSPTLHLLTVTNAASYLSGNITPDEIVTLFGPNLASAKTVRITDSSGTSNNASLLFVSAAQASIIMPAGIAAGPATVSITSPSRTLSAPVNIAAVAPGLFTADGSGQGAPAAQVITLNPDGTQSAPAPATSPIDLSGGPVYLVLYGTGLRHAATPVICTIAGKTAQVLYAGAQGSMAGLDQVNILIPASLKSAGLVTLQLTADKISANPVTLTLR